MSIPLRYRLHAQTQEYARAVHRAHHSLRKAAAHGRVLIASSWGKDSVAMIGLALFVYPTVDVFHLRSAYRLPGDEDLVQWATTHPRILYHEVPSSRDLRETIEWVRDVGLPHDRTASQETAIMAQNKSDPCEDFCRQHGFEVIALGLRSDESRGRAMNASQRGDIYTKRGGMMVSTPIVRWSSMDVWSYIYANSLPYNRRIYDAETHGQSRETIRNSGWLTTIGAKTRGRIAWLRAHFPDQYRQLATEFPEVSQYA